MMRRGYPLVAAQVVALVAVFLWPGRPLWSSPDWVHVFSTVLVVLGFVMMIAGAWALGRDLTVFADPKREARLRTNGAYAISRNPIYAGLLLIAMGHVLTRGRPESVAALVVLVLVLYVKTGLEERNLTEAFGQEYLDYARRVPRLLGLPRRGR